MSVGKVVGRNRDDIVEGKGGGIQRIYSVVVAVGISGRGDHEDSALADSVNGVVERLRISVSSPTITGGDNIHATIPHHGHVVETSDRARIGTAIQPQELAGENFCLPIHPCDAKSVVAGCT